MATHDDLCEPCMHSDSSDSDIDQEAGLTRVSVNCELSSADKTADIHHYLVNASRLTFTARTTATTEATSGVVFPDLSTSWVSTTEVRFRASLLRRPDTSPTCYEIHLVNPTLANGDSQSWVKLETTLGSGARVIRSLKQLTVPFKVVVDTPA